MREQERRWRHAVAFVSASLIGAAGSLTALHALVRLCRPYTGASSVVVLVGWIVAPVLGACMGVLAMRLLTRFGGVDREW
jgi:hypothetical protein